MVQELDQMHSETKMKMAMNRYDSLNKILNQSPLFKVSQEKIQKLKKRKSKKIVYISPQPISAADQYSFDKRKQIVIEESV